MVTGSQSHVWSGPHICYEDPIYKDIEAQFFLKEKKRSAWVLVWGQFGQKVRTVSKQARLILDECQYDFKSRLQWERCESKKLGGSDLNNL